MTSMDVIAECMLRVKEGVCSISYDVNLMRKQSSTMEMMLVELRRLNENIEKMNKAD